MKITFIGFGNMAKAIAAGLAGNSRYELRASAPSLPQNTSTAKIKTDPSNLAFLSDADVLILAVKPALMKTVLTEINEHLSSSCLILSIAAGLSLAWFDKQCKTTKPAIVRAMPNVAAAVAKSATPMIANARVTPLQKKWAEELFRQIGLAAWVDDEQQMNAFTALSGSGPAYIFLFMESMMQTAVRLGLPAETAQSFTLQTFAGAVSLSLAKKQPLAELREQVTSPNGTTAAALDIFMQQNLNTLVETAMQAAFKRANELEQS
ncbi:pyrroline-5-carboxylate reductase [Legionella septentrionalis]|uniref:Pyrroline-5-carboxylate reductase n=1 Tax=Legionella septentrionalis TaxID=2498109 RepID=A0A433JM25_9GAMM|nr:pyrroline-5-carboxylate reductase [Legionella septentrionalis]RUQ90733.1 pyrroline-5-carboxylate reductase [Legionella septentrionalis]RUR15794.1 pyrroline-5-carboxylate reductase [Legionella septentrionalis]